VRRANLLIAGFVVLVVLLGAGLFVCREGLLAAVLRPISFVSRLVSSAELRETDGRVNVLVLGLDSRAGGGPFNTDTILVGSLSLAEGDPVLISIPRDLYVSFQTGGSGKINSAFAAAALQSGGTLDREDEMRGAEAAKATVAEVLGIPIHYWVVVDFEGFEEIVDTLGGIEVCVDRTFDDYRYPVPGKEDAFPLSARYEHLHFDAGCQLMDGERALKYSRSRMGTAGEGSDFARARRQQKVVSAVKDKVLSLSLLFNPGKIATLYRQFTEAVGTDAPLDEVQRAIELLYKFREELGDVESLVLDPGSGLTKRGYSDDGAYIIVPSAGDFSAIHKAVQELLFGADEKELSE